MNAACNEVRRGCRGRGRHGRADEQPRAQLFYQTLFRVERNRKKYGWALWGCIQNASSPVDFDFWEWGMERYEGAVAEFTGPDFSSLLDDVQATD